jgi:hypothetical protein
MSPRRRAPVGDRLVELIAVILLGIATVGTAWCGYQASRWNGESADLAREAINDRIEASRLYGLGVQAVAYDAGMIAEYAQAFRSSDDGLLRFYRQSLIRPGLIPLLDAWEADVEAGRAPPNLLTDQEYLDEQLGPYREAEARATATEADSDAAGRTANQYILTTLFLATSLFLSGVTSSFESRFVRLLLLFGAGLAILLAATRLVDLPVI